MLGILPLWILDLLTNKEKGIQEATMWISNILVLWNTNPLQTIVLVLFLSMTEDMVLYKTSLVDKDWSLKIRISLTKNTKNK